MSVYGGDEPMPKEEDSPLNGKNFYANGKKASESYLSLFSSKNIKTRFFKEAGVKKNRILGMAQNHCQNVPKTVR